MVRAITSLTSAARSKNFLIPEGLSSETFSEKFAFVGPSIRSATEKIEKKREKLIYISMGTVNNDMMPFYKTCISALKDTNYQVIISIGN